jgi:hypothetical protein
MAQKPHSESEPSAVQQLRELSEVVDESWRQTANHFRAAAFEIIDPDFLTDALKLELEHNFWAGLALVAESLSQTHPSIMESILARAEQIAQADREAEMIYFEQHVLPKLHRRYFWRNLIGQAYDGRADYQEMMARRKAV